MMKKNIVIVLLTIALLFVLAGIGAVLFFTFNGGSIDFSSGGFDITAAAEESKTLKVDGPVTLKVFDDAGDVSVTGADVDDVTIEINKRGYGRNQTLAEEALNNIEYTVEQDGNSISVTFDYPKLEGQIKQQVDFLITVPFETTVEVDALFGKLNVTDIIGDVRLINQFGNMTADNIDGALEVNTDSGLINVTAVKAGSKNISVNSGFGSAYIEQVSGANITIESKSGALDIVNVRATKDMRLLTEFGNIDFESGAAATLYAETNSGEIALTSITVNDLLTIRDEFGSVKLEKALAKSYDVDVKSGTITMDGVQGNIQAQSGFGGIILRKAENVTLDIQTKSGTIDFSGSLGEGPHTVHSDFGGIHLNLAADTALNVDLETEFGNISSEIPVTFTLTGNIKEGKQSGTMNGGGPEFKVSTKSGNIIIKVLK